MVVESQKPKIEKKIDVEDAYFYQYSNTAGNTDGFVMN